MAPLSRMLRAKYAKRVYAERSAHSGGSHMVAVLKARAARKRREALLKRQVQPTQAEFDAALAREARRMQSGATAPS